MTDPKTTVTVHSAKQLGWLRRPELDTRTGDAWERPDGTLQLLEKGRQPEVVTLAPKRKRTQADHAYLAWLAKRDGGGR